VSGSCHIGFLLRALLWVLLVSAFLILASGGYVSSLMVTDSSGNIETCGINTVCVKVLLDSKVTLRPFSSRTIGAEDQHQDRNEGDDDKGYNEGDSPCNVRC
jgi:hypothetical protein